MLTGLDRSLLPDGKPFALAFSGGGDSLALLHELKSDKRLVAVLHVDHGLRQSSEREAEQARALAASLGHELTILRWRPDRPRTGLQEKARRARYRLLGDACRTRGIDTLVTAHHADDQAETVLMRLQRGSGWRGAAGMRPCVYAPVWPELAGVTLVRPALRLRRESLRSRLGSLAPVEDPSNENRAFSRIRARHMLRFNPGLRADMLDLAHAMREGLAVERANLTKELDGFSISYDGLFTAPRLPGTTALALLAPIIGGQSGPANRTKIATRREALLSGKPVSIGEGCVGHWDGSVLKLSRDRVAVTGRSDRNLRPTATAMDITAEPIIWDGRFLVSGEAGQIRPLDENGHIGYRIFYGRNVTVRNLVAERLDAALTGM